jgi:hypothetical protein
MSNADYYIQVSNTLKIEINTCGSRRKPRDIRIADRSLKFGAFAQNAKTQRFRQTKRALNPLDQFIHHLTAFEPYCWLL